METVYFDHAAFTPMEPAAIDAMSTAARELHGNPQSMHRAGRQSFAAIEEARANVGAYLGTDPTELCFFASATDALSAAVSLAVIGSDGPIVSSAIEHPGLMRAVGEARRQVEIIPSPAGEYGASSAETMQSAATVALSACNHELGTAPDLRPLREASASARWVVDAVQAAPWIDLGHLCDARTLFVVSSAKLGGPPGAAALRVPHALRGLALAQLLQSTSTPSWLAIIGFGAAAKARSGAGAVVAALMETRARAGLLLAGLRRINPSIVHNAGASWLGTILNVSLPGTDALSIENALDLAGIAVSRTAACRQRFDRVSSLVQAAFASEPWRARASVRFSLGWCSNDRDVNEALQRSESVFGPHASHEPGSPSGANLSALSAIPGQQEETR